MSTNADRGITEKNLTGQTESTSTQVEAKGPKPATQDDVDALIEEMKQKAQAANKTTPREDPKTIVQQVEQIGEEIRGKAKKLEDADTV